MSTSDGDDSTVNTVERDTVIVEYDQDTQVTTVTFNRPGKKNAMNPTLHQDMMETMAEVKEDALDPNGATNILVITGTEDSFCAGQDLEESFLDYEDDPYMASQRIKLSGEWADELFNFPVPTIAAVNGYAFGGGFRVCCMCDLAIASEEATFGLSEINFGHLVAGGTTRIASYTLSPRDFKYLAYSGRSIDAEKADDIRLVNDVVPHEDLYDEVYELAEEMAEKNTMAMQMCKEVYMTEWRQGMRKFSDARSYETGKSRELDWLQEGESMRAIEAFVDDQYKPGEESYNKEDIESKKD